MKKKNKNGFFLSETMVVIAIVAIVLLSVFKIFSSVYTKYKESENYNTINATNTAVQLKKYYQSRGLDYTALLGGNYYVDLTNSATYDSEHYDNLKATLKVDKVYLVNMAQVYTGTNINVFNTSLRKYLKTLQNSDASVSLITVSDGSEYGSVTVVTTATVTLNGDVNNEYEVVVPLGGTFVDTGYTNWSGNPPTTTWETAFDNTKEGTYYLKYSFDGFILRRRVVVSRITYNYDYTGGMQSLTVAHTGYYKLEVWGAQGNGIHYGGFGGYSVGVVSLTKNDVLYVYVGGQGGSGCTAVSCAGGYNGGGAGGANTLSAANIQSGGGGATHIATASGLLSALSSNRGSILIVAGGGGAGYYHTNGDNYSSAGGNGGGFQGNNGTVCVYGVIAAGGGTQSAGGTAGYRGAVGSFGQGGTGPSGNSDTLNGSSGGGGGFYGGGASGHSGTGGGSGYIANALLLTRNGVTKSMYCVNCTASAVASTLTYSTGNATAIPTSNFGKIGNGYAKITFLSSN